MIYFFDGDEEISSPLIEKALALMPEKRRLSAEGCIPSVRLESVVSFCLLLYGLSAEYGITHSVSLNYSENGKPCLKEGYPFFNLSHSHGACACSLSSEETGVDLEKIRLPSEALVRRVCNENEGKIAVSAEGFTRLWTQKEGYIKRFALTIGELSTLPDFSRCSEDERVYQVGETRLFTRRLGDFYLTCCGKPEVELIRVGARELSRLIADLEPKQ